MPEKIMFYCPIQKKDFAADDIKKAKKQFLCKNCQELESGICVEPMLKNQEADESAVRRALKNFAANPKTKRLKSGEAKKIVLLFYKEICDAVEANYGFNSIARILKNSGYVTSCHPHTLRMAFKAINKTLAANPEHE